MAVGQKLRMSAISGKIRMGSLGHRSTYLQNSLKCPLQLDVVPYYLVITITCSVTSYISYQDVFVYI